jgi:uncharacterized protein (DUF608 family)
MTRASHDPYREEHLRHIAFPLGGIGAGMVSLTGQGGLAQVSILHEPALRNEPRLFAAVHADGAARVLEGPVPDWKITHTPQSGNGCFQTTYGLPRFAECAFQPRFPFAAVRIHDDRFPLQAELTGWSPFEPLHSDDASLPVAAVEYRLLNRTARPLSAVFSFHAEHFVRTPDSAPVLPPRAVDGGFVLETDGSCHSPFFATWQASALQPAVASIAQARPVRLTDSLGWHSLTADRGGFVNVSTCCGSAHGLIYLARRVALRQAGDWQVLLGHDGPAALFIDGRRVAMDEALRNPALPDRTAADVTLSAGEHEIVVALDTARGMGQGIFLRFALPASLRHLPMNQRPAFPQGQAESERSPVNRAAFAAFVLEPGAQVDVGWFRGGWFDDMTMLWDRIASGVCDARPAHADAPPSPGASVYLPLDIPAYGERRVRLLLCWHVPTSRVRFGPEGVRGADLPGEPRTYEPWYARRFADIDAVIAHWRDRYDELRAGSQRFSDCFHDTTLPAEVLDAVAANLTILKSPTCLRQHDGRFWAWEGTMDSIGSCYGSCTHVWNYAQALPHLFPDLERSLRQTELEVSQDERGHQMFRTSLPIRPTSHEHPAASDGQLGGVMKVYREWRICGDTAWLRSLWPRVRQSLDYCIREWDPNHTGTLVEPHHNTYDIEFWGANGMTTSLYLGALTAALAMGRACGDSDLALIEQLLGRGRLAMEHQLWNGEFFVQQLRWRDASHRDKWLHRQSPTAQSRDWVERHGPKYQYEGGCLADGVIGAWLAACCGIDLDLDAGKIAGHLAAVYRHNFKPTLAQHANPQRPGYALGNEPGLLMCTWPRGGRPTLPMVYSHEVWTGVEYQVAAHLIMTGQVEQGLTLVRAARSRYDGRARNPFAEVECGYWYARAMSSYSLIQALSGIRYDAVTRTLHMRPRVSGDFRSFLCTASGYGHAGVRAGQPYFDPVFGSVNIEHIDFVPQGATVSQT